MAASTADRNWAELGPELLGSIVELLTAMDAVRFRAVCTAWASAAPPLNGGLYLPRAIEMPHLLIPLAADEADGYCTLLSLPDGRAHRLGPLPDLRGAKRQLLLLGSQDGWLVVLDGNSDYSLLNPLTRSRIRLPSELSFPHCVKKVVTTPNPTPSSYAAVGLRNTAVVFFTRAGMDEWAILQVLGGGHVEDAIFSNGRFLTVSSDGTVHALLLQPTTTPSPEFTLVAPAPLPALTSNRSRRYLAEDSASGDLLQVCLQIENDIDEEGDYVSRIGGLEVWRLEMDAGRNGWLPVKSLADRSLFVGSCHSLCLSARDAAGLRPNCVYLAPHHWDSVTEGVVGVYSLEDGSVEPCWTNAKQLPSWPPLWIRPTLCNGE